jgi:S1-C subfamily serine protease
MTREQVAAAQQRTSETTPKEASGKETAHGAQVDSSSTPPRASGSGFFITRDGYFLTSAHVIADADHLVIKTRGATLPATVVKADYANDVALLRISGHFEPLAIIPSSTVKLGGAVLTIGFPNPQMQGYEPKLTDGKISSLAGAQDDVRFFQISAPVQPGNSGGPLVDARGNAVGVVTARLSDRAAMQASGAIPQNVNYALKSSYVLSFLEAV